MKMQNRSAVLAAVTAGSIYLLAGLAWHFTNFYMEGPAAFDGSIIFFIVHMPGLLLAKLFYAYDQTEPVYIKHLVALFMVGVNAVLFGLMVWFWKELERRIAEGASRKP